MKPLYGWSIHLEQPSHRHSPGQSCAPQQMMCHLSVRTHGVDSAGSKIPNCLHDEEIMADFQICVHLFQQPSPWHIHPSVFLHASVCESHIEVIRKQDPITCCGCQNWRAFPHHHFRCGQSQGQLEASATPLGNVSSCRKCIIELGSILNKGPCGTSVSVLPTQMYLRELLQARRSLPSRSFEWADTAQGVALNQNPSGQDGLHNARCHLPEGAGLPRNKVGGCCEAAMQLS